MIILHPEWMPLPQSIQARPPGLEYLEELNEIRIQQTAYSRK